MKKWYHSKTLWVNTIAIVAIIAQAHYGFVINPEEQVGLLAIVNLILRAVTKEPLYELR